MLWNHAHIRAKKKRPTRGIIAYDRQKYRVTMTSRTHLDASPLLTWSITANAIRRTLRRERRGDSARDVILARYRIIHPSVRGRARSLQITVSKGHEGTTLCTAMCSSARRGWRLRRGSGTRDERLAWAYLRVLQRDEDGNKKRTGPSTIVPTFPSPFPLPRPRMKSSGGNKKFFQKKENFFNL